MSRAEDLAADLERAYSAFADYSAGLSAEQWRQTAVNHPQVAAGEDERRPVGVVAHHLGETLPMFTERALALARGNQLNPMAPAEVDAANDRHAAVNPAPDQPETVAMIRDNVSRAADLIRELSDEQLDRPGEGPLSAWTAERMVRRVVIGHVDWHEGSIRAAVGA
jgi:DinB superfamily